MPVVSRMFALLSAVTVAVSLAAPARAADPAPPDSEVKTMPVDLSLLVYCDPGDPAPGVDWTDAARRAIDIWNEAVPTIRLTELPPTPSTVSPTGECVRDAPDDSIILRLRHYTTTHGVSSHMYSEGFGRGWVFLENSDFTTYDPVRVVAHEIGHILSLQDVDENDCSQLMTGGHAVPDCHNQRPDAAETAAVAAFAATHPVGACLDWFAGDPCISDSDQSVRTDHPGITDRAADRQASAY